MKHLEHMRSITEGAPNELALASQFALLGLGSGLEGSLIGWDGGSGGDSSEKDGLDSSSGSAVDDKDDDDDELLRSYVHDFVCMQCPPVDGMSRKAQADFLWHVLSRPQIDRTKPTTNGSRGDEEEEEEEEGGQQSAGKPYDSNNDAGEGKSGDGNGDDDDDDDDNEGTGKPKKKVPDRLETLAGVHYRYWRVEQVLGLYFALMGAVPAFKQPLLDFFRLSSSSTTATPTATIPAVLLRQRCERGQQRRR